MSISLNDINKRLSSLEASAGQKHYIKDMGGSANGWYRIYSNGLIEQGGYASGSNGFQINLIKPFSSTDYAIIATDYKMGWGYMAGAKSRTTTKFNCDVWQTAHGDNNTALVGWIAIGYLISNRLLGWVM